MPGIKEAANLIEAYTPLKVSSIERAGEGMHNEAFLVNASCLFRFAKTEDDKQKIKKESLLLPAIKPLLPVSIPSPDYVSPDFSFIAHQKLSGVFLTPELYAALTPAKQKILLHSLASFLTTLHNVNIDALNIPEVERTNFESVYREDFAEVKQDLFPSLPTDEQKLIAKRFSSYFENPENFAYKPALLHGDFSLDHILLRADNQTLKAVIDFGDAAVGDPDYDLFYLYKQLGEIFIHDLLQFYSCPNHALLLEKLRFFVFVETLHDRIEDVQQKNG